MAVFDVVLITLAIWLIAITGFGIWIAINSHRHYKEMQAEHRRQVQRVKKALGDSDA